MTSLPEIEAAIQTRGAKWQAADTPFFDMPVADLQGMFGLSIGSETESLLVGQSRRARFPSTFPASENGLARSSRRKLGYAHKVSGDVW
jgi:hypothetical protein